MSDRLESFKETLQQTQPPKEVSRLLQALWWDAKDDWDRAHEIAQGVGNSEGAWVHAYLHRKEGDEFNAGYWYDRAGRQKSFEPLENEWEEIVSELLAK